MAELNGLTLVADANLKSYYRADDTTDSIGGITLTNVNSTTFTTAKYGNGFNFGNANSNKYMVTSSNHGIGGDEDASFSFWVKCLAEIGSSTWHLVDHASTTSADRTLKITYDYNGGTRRLQVDASGTVTNYNITLGTTDFYHIVVTRNVAGNSAHLWVNGVDVANGTLGSTTQGNNYIGIGADGTAANFASVLIDDVALFDKVLSQAEILQLYSDGSSGFFNFF